MEILKYMETYDYEQLVICQDKASGLKAIIAIHDTTLGPALGGCRMWKYNSEEEAIEDALRLARGMTYKNAAAGLNLGGGKTVIIGDPFRDKNEAMFRALGRFIQSLNGRYITAEDVGTTVADMDIIHEETDYVTGISPAFGSSGNPSPVTAYGVFLGMKAAAKERLGVNSLANVRVAVQGLGNVAYTLCDYLHKEGAILIVTDINEQAVARVVEDFGATAVAPDDIYNVDAEIFAPCALGGIVNEKTIEQFTFKVIAGSANNQLLSSEFGQKLHDAGILYAPDYVINAGGVINVADELNGYNRERAMKRVETIYDSLVKIFEISKAQNIPTYLAANRLAEQRISTLARSTRQFVSGEKNIISNRT